LPFVLLEPSVGEATFKTYSSVMSLSTRMQLKESVSALIAAEKIAKPTKDINRRDEWNGCVNIIKTWCPRPASSYLIDNLETQLI